MRTIVAGLASLALLALLGAGARAAGFHEGVKLEAGGQAIDVEVGHLVPCVVDWNGDGKRDLVVGQFSGGKIRLYLNEGTDRAPKLGAFTYLEAGGKEISLPAG